MNRRMFLKAMGIGAAAVAALARRAGAATRAAAAGGTAAGKGRDNIIFILGDDLGYAELGCYGNAFNETPNLDRLAREGMRFTDAYAAAPVCSPYRAALMTGQHPARVGITDYLRPDDPKHLGPDSITIAEALKSAGYATGIIGKWHLTGYASAGAKEVPPSQQGFDEVIVSETHGIGGGSYFWPYHFNPQVKQRLPGREHLIDRLNLEAMEFIQRHRDGPFFLYLSHYAVHTALVGREDLVAKYKAKAAAAGGPKGRNNPHLAAQLEAVDAGVGQIVAKLRELDLAQQTLILFTGDNGGEDRVTSNAPLRAGKSTLYEGGLRVPLVAWCPPLVPAAATCRTPTCNYDFHPTLCELAGRPAEPGKLDGVSILPLLKDPQAKLERDTFCWHYPLARPHFLGGRSAGAIRRGDWKLIEFLDTGARELYNLAEDIGEENDLAARMPGKAAELASALVEWRRKVGAEIPDNCRNYDPKADAAPAKAAPSSGKAPSRKP